MKTQERIAAEHDFYFRSVKAQEIYKRERGLNEEQEIGLVANKSYLEALRWVSNHQEDKLIEVDDNIIESIQISDDVKPYDPQEVELSYCIKSFKEELIRDLKSQGKFSEDAISAYDLGVRSALIAHKMVSESHKNK